MRYFNRNFRIRIIILYYEISILSANLGGNLVKLRRIWSSLYETFHFIILGLRFKYNSSYYFSETQTLPLEKKTDFRQYSLIF
jgi:hypothetical protein